MLLEDADRARSQAENYSLKQKLLQGVSSLVRGPVQAYLFHSFGFLGGLPAAIGFMGVSTLTNSLNANNQRDQLTNSYRDELAVITRKDRNSITSADFDRVAQSSSVGSPIRRDYEISSQAQHATQIKSLIKNLAISAAVMAFAFIGGGMVMNMVGFTIIGGLSLAIDLITENTLGRWQQKQQTLSAKFVDQISGDMSRGLVSPVKLLEYSAVTNPQTKDIIRQQFHADYNMLTFRQKAQALSMLGMEGTLTAIANDLNNGALRASELPFLLAGQNSPSTQFVRYAAAPAPRQKQQTPVAAERVADAPSITINQAQVHGQVAAHEAERVVH